MESKLLNSDHFEGKHEYKPVFGCLECKKILKQKQWDNLENRKWFREKINNYWMQERIKNCKIGDLIVSKDEPIVAWMVLKRSHFSFDLKIFSTGEIWKNCWIDNYCCGKHEIIEA